MASCAFGTELWVDAEKGDDSNPGTKEYPLKTPDIAVWKCGDLGGLIHLNGVFYGGIYIKKVHFKEKLVVNGHGSTIFYAFDGKFHDFDPAHQPYRNWNMIKLLDCGNVHLKNMEVWGGCDYALNINDSYPTIGVKNVILDKITVKYGAPRCIFMGGDNIDGVTIKNCTVRENIYGDTTHGIYLSGGHWNPDYPPIRNIKVVGNTVSYAGGRHCIQINGRFENVTIMNNRLYHGELAGLSMIGVKNGLVAHNEIYGNNRQAIVIYDYKDGWYDPNNPASVELWKKTHHQNQNILIRRNTIVVGPHQYKVDLWHNNDPKTHAAILVNNEVNQEIDYPPKNFFIVDNIIHSPNEKVIRFYHEAEAKATRVYGNIVWTTVPSATAKVTAPLYPGIFEFEFLEQYFPTFYKDNVIADPSFRKGPNYPFINLCADPNYNWCEHLSEADFFSKIGKKLKKGKWYPGEGVGSNKGGR
jgi:hypothetical protein